MFRIVSVFALLIVVGTVAAHQPSAPGEPYTPPRAPSPRPMLDSRVQAASSAPDAGAKNSADYALLEQKLAERDRLQVEIDQLRQATGTPQQILVRLKVIEVSRTKMRRLGVDFTSASDKGKLGTNGVDLSQLGVPGSSDLLGSHAIDSDDNFNGFLRALAQNDFAKVLAEPMIVVATGRPATFNFGGQIPIPTGPETYSPVEFLEVGTKVDVTAFARSENTVHLDLRVRVSEADYEYAIKIKDAIVPRIEVRVIDTTLEMSFGKSRLLTGMVERRRNGSENGAENTSGFEEIETLLIVTPEAVAPVAALPADGKQVRDGAVRSR